MSLADLLRRIVDRLDGAGVAHMLAGSVASSVHGEPRTTHDVDIVIEANRASLVTFLRALPAEEYYVDEDVALEALRTRSQFNVIDLSTGWKVDLIIRRDRPFSVEEFQRRRGATLFGVAVQVASPEDTIIAKLEWARDSQSERQLRDIAGILRVSGETIDREYLQRWIEDLGLAEIWSRVEQP
jgi:hypothetical protein